MKTSKASAAFLTKFSTFIAKFKQSSTVNVAHEQIRKLFSEYKWSDIAIPFASKMDSCDQLSDKQKKQYVKIYISLIDVYGQEIILQQYDRVIDSIAKKSAGVGDVIGHLCRNLLKRIYPTENIANYIKHLFLVFQRHIELLKIIKQIVQSFDSQIIAPFQSQIMGIINQKMNTNPKNLTKAQYLQAILAMVLSLQSKFYEQTITQQIISKNFKNDEWSVRKHCVDISYALLVIKTEVNTYLHENVLQLKYDKIKHVRDSVNNYTTLYKQIYGEQKQKQKPKQRQPISRKVVGVPKEIKETKQSKNVQERRTITSRSPIIPQRFKVNQETKNNPKFLQKSIRNASRNQQFFQNAGTKDIIKLPESKSHVFEQKHHKALSPKHRIKQSKSFTANVNVILPQQQKQYKQQKQIHGNQQNSNFNSINFEQYLKHRPKQDNYLVFSSQQKKHHQNLPNQRIMSSFNPLDKMGVSPKSGIKMKEQIRQNKKVIQQLPPPSRTVQSKLTYQAPSDQMGYQLKKQLQNVQSKFQNFSIIVLQKLTNLQKRIQTLQNKKQKQPHHYIEQMSLSSLQKDIKDMRNQANSYLEESFDHKFNQIMNKSNNKYSKQQKYQGEASNDSIVQRQKISKNSNQSMPAQSNLNQKIQHSLQQGNWDQAFSLAIANNSRPAILQLLTYYQIPKDKLVQDCLFVQLRRNLSNWVVLKWLIHYTQQTDISIDKVKKLMNDLKRSQQVIQNRSNTENQIRNYNMLKSLLLNELNARLEQEGNNSNSKNTSVEGFNFMNKAMF